MGNSEFLWFRKQSKTSVQRMEGGRPPRLPDPHRSRAAQPGASLPWREHIVPTPASIQTWSACRNPPRYRTPGDGSPRLEWGFSTPLSSTLAKCSRAAIIAGAHAVIVAHNHPSETPLLGGGTSERPRISCRLDRLLRVELLDHVVMGMRPNPSKIVGLLSPDTTVPNQSG